MNLSPKPLIAGLVTLLVSAIAIPIVIIGMVIAPTSPANSPDQQLNDCDTQMRAAGVLAQNAPATTVTGPNADPTPKPLSQSAKRWASRPKASLLPWRQP